MLALLKKKQKTERKKKKSKNQSPAEEDTGGRRWNRILLGHREDRRAVRPVPPARQQLGPEKPREGRERLPLGSPGQDIIC